METQIILSLLTAEIKALEAKKKILKVFISGLESDASYPEYVRRIDNLSAQQTILRKIGRKIQKLEKIYIQKM